MTIQPTHSRPQPDTLADVLERVLDKGIVIAGDVVVNVLDIELLTLKLRLFIASADTAREMGMDWWTTDPFFSSQAPPQVQQADPEQVEAGGTQRHTQRQLQEENDRLRQRVAELEGAERPGGGRRS
jgi:hypothetical protein